jgi:hypothetical protein
VATVTQAGVVTAVNEGIATITATALDGSGKSGACAVTVAAVVVEPRIYVVLGPTGANPGPAAGLYVDGVKDATIGDQDMVDVYVDDAGNVYAAGWYYGSGAHYVNGEPTAFGHGAYGMTVSGGHVYVAGYDTVSGTHADLWKDGESVALNGAGVGTTVAHGVTLDSGGHVYVGAWTNELENHRHPVIWKDGEKYLNADIHNQCIIDLIVADDGILTATLMNMDAASVPQYTAWTVQPNALATGWTRIESEAGDNFVRLFRDGQDVYMAGYNAGSPYYWKSNGSSWAKVALPSRAGAQWTQGRDIYVHPNGSVYVLGMSLTASSNYQPEVWVDGALIDDARRLPTITGNPIMFCGIFAK